MKSNLSLVFILLWMELDKGNKVYIFLILVTYYKLATFSDINFIMHGAW